MEEKHMKLRTAAFLVALSATACTSAPDEPLASDIGSSAPIAIQASQVNPDNAASVPAPQSTSAQQMPAGFVEYASEKVAGTSLTCVVGASPDEDGMNQRPVVKLASRSAQMLWTTTLQVPVDYYQGRATHCTSSGATLFVLLQFDTQPAQTLSQTHLQVAKLALGDGAIEQTTSIAVPGASEPYSAWVPDASSNFSFEAGKLFISGRFFVIDDEVHQRSFKTTLDPARLD
jgi:hypothetical protein